MRPLKDYLLNWRLMAAIVGGALVTVLVIVIVWEAVSDNREERRNCEQYAETKMRDVPAKCVNFWGNG